MSGLIRALGWDLKVDAYVCVWVCVCVCACVCVCVCVCFGSLIRATLYATPLHLGGVLLRAWSSEGPGTSLVL